MFAHWFSLYGFITCKSHLLFYHYLDIDIFLCIALWDLGPVQFRKKACLNKKEKNKSILHVQACVLFCFSLVSVFVYDVIR